MTTTTTTKPKSCLGVSVKEHKQAMCGLIVFLLVVVCLLVVVFAVWMPQDKAKFEAKFRRTPMNITALTLNPFKDAAKVNCQCLEVPETTPTCSSMVDLLQDGTCNDGYQCCSYTRVCRTDIDGNRRCGDLCVVSVLNQACYSYVYDSYRPRINVTFPLHEEELTPTQIHNYEQCRSLHECSEGGFACPACLYIIEAKASLQGLCTGVTDSRECATAFFRNFTVGEIVTEAGYEKDDPSDIHFGSTPSWSIPGFFVVVIVLLFVCAIAALVGMYLIRKRDEEMVAKAAKEKAEAAKAAKEKAEAEEEEAEEKADSTTAVTIGSMTRIPISDDDDGDMSRI
jgi:uncharacterized membrane protein